MQTPNPTDRHTQAFCAHVTKGSKPRLLPIQPAPNALPLECFPNVTSEVDRKGGRIVYGWSIWELPGIYIEAEHHAVYEDAHGNWVDVTPSDLPHITHRLFVADDGAVFEGDDGMRRDNIRHALVRDPLVQTLFETSKARNAILDAIPGFGQIHVPLETARRIEALEMENARAIYALGMKYTPRNSPCFCGSGKKFKKCHGALIRE